MIRLFLVTALLLLGHVAAFAQPAVGPCDDADPAVDRLKTQQQRVLTRYWLGRARNSSWFELKQAGEEARRLVDMATNALETSTPDRHQCFQSFIRAAEEQLRAAERQTQNAKRTFGGAFPLLQRFTRVETGMPWGSSTASVAGRRATEAVFKAFGQRFIVKDIQPYLVVLADRTQDERGVSHASVGEVEAASRAWLARASPAYPISPTEMGKLLTQEEIRFLSALDFNSPDIKEKLKRGEPLMSKLAAAYGQETFGLLRLVRNDEVDGLAYYGAYYHRYLAKEREFAPRVYQDGFAERVTERKVAALVFALCALFLVIALSLFSRRRQGGRAIRWLEPAAAVACVVLSFAISRPLVTWAPDPSTVFPGDVALVWLVGAVAALTFLPGVVVYMVGARMVRVAPFLGLSQTMPGFIFASLSGSFVLFGCAGIVRFPLAQSVWPVTAWLVMLCVATARSHGVISDIITDRESLRPTAIAALLIQALALVVGLVFVLTWNHDMVLLGSLAFVVLTVTAGTIDWLGARASASDAGEVTTALGELLYEHQYQHYFARKDPNRRTQEPFELVFDFLHSETDIDRIDLVILEGRAGIGKTALARHLEENWSEGGGDVAGETDPAKRDYQCRRASCSMAGQEMAYGPIRELFRGSIQKGVLVDPKARLGGSGVVEQAMDILGVPGVDKFLSGDEDSGEALAKASLQHAIEAVTGEMGVQGADSDHTTHLFIIENVHWMDSASTELFERWFEDTVSAQDKNNFGFVLSATLGENGEHCEIVDFLLAKMHPRYRHRLNLLHITEEVIVQNEEKVEQGEHGVFSLSREFVRKLLRRGYGFGDSDADSLTELLLQDSRGKVKRDLTVGSIIEGLQLFQQHGLITPATGGNDASSEAQKEGRDQGSLQWKADKAVNVAQLLRQQRSACVDLYYESLETAVTDALECAAIAGRTFHLEVLSGMLDVERLPLLRLMREAEQAGIVRDLGHHEGRFEFMTDNLRMGFRDRAHGGLRGARGLRQLTSHHYRLFVETTEAALIRKHGQLQHAPPNALWVLARRALEVRTAIADRALDLVMIAARAHRAQSQFRVACRLFSDARESFTSDRLHVPTSTWVTFLLDGAHTFLESARSTEARAFLDDAQAKIDAAATNGELQEPRARLYWLFARYFYDIRKWGECREWAQKLRDCGEIPAHPRLRGRFYEVISPSTEDDETKCTQLGQLVEDARGAVAASSDDERSSLMALLGEVLNHYARTLLNQKQWDRALIQAQEAERVNEQGGKGHQRARAITCGVLGDYYFLSPAKDLEKAQACFSQNLELSYVIGDYDGLVRMTSMLGSLSLERLENKAAFDFYRRSLKYASRRTDGTFSGEKDWAGAPLDTKRLQSSLFALAGLTRVAGQSIDKKDWPLSMACSVMVQGSLNALREEVQSFQQVARNQDGAERGAALDVSKLEWRSKLKWGIQGLNDGRRALGQALAAAVEPTDAADHLDEDVADASGRSALQKGRGALESLEEFTAIVSTPESVAGV